MQVSLYIHAVWSTNAFVIGCLDSIAPIDSISKISRPLPASVAEQASSSLWSHTSEENISLMSTRSFRTLN